MTNRNYTTPTVASDWADTHNTDMAVAVAIHAIAGSERPPEAIWESPSPTEYDHVTMAVEEYVKNGDFDFDPRGYCWGQETIHIEQDFTEEDDLDDIRDSDPDEAY